MSCHEVGRMISPSHSMSSSRHKRLMLAGSGQVCKCRKLKTKRATGGLCPLSQQVTCSARANRAFNMNDHILPQGCSSKGGGRILDCRWWSWLVSKVLRVKSCFENINPHSHLICWLSFHLPVFGVWSTLLFPLFIAMAKEKSCLRSTG